MIYMIGLHISRTGSLLKNKKNVDEILRQNKILSSKTYSSRFLFCQILISMKYSINIKKYISSSFPLMFFIFFWL